jgi:NADPH:quinone reductase-like Zn-dependent oxidoreductase
MKAFILDGYGSADRVRAGDVPDPEVHENDVLVQIHAAGVNSAGFQNQNRRVRSFCITVCRSFWAMTWPGS